MPPLIQKDNATFGWDGEQYIFYAWIKIQIGRQNRKIFRILLPAILVIYSEDVYLETLITLIVAVFDIVISSPVAIDTIKFFL